MASKQHTSRSSRYQTVGGEESRRTFRRNLYILLGAAFGILMVQLLSQSCSSASMDYHDEHVQDIQDRLAASPLIDHVDTEWQRTEDDQPTLLVRAIFSAEADSGIEKMLVYVGVRLADLLLRLDPDMQIEWRFYRADQRESKEATYVGNTRTSVGQLIDIAEREPVM